MKSIYSKLVLISLLLATVSTTVSARECIECKKTNAKKVTIQSKAAVCKRAQSTAELNINNVRALINGYGNMWYDGSVAKYHLPKNSNTCPLFCAALWIGGTDVNDQLRLAALKFGSDGDDYWTGPLKINGTASVDLPVCNQYDKHWIITKAEVLAHKAHFEYDSNGATIIDGYSAGDIPDIIRDWPAHGDGDDLTSFLAPFYDANKNGVYEPEQGDYPYYDFDNELCPRTLKAEWGDKYTQHVLPTQEDVAGIVTGGLLSDQVLKGDQTIWWVFNDKGNTHTESKGESIGLEIRAQAFAFSTNDEINNMTFYSYEIINRSTYELRETYFSQWVDPDLGYAWDDFVGCDVRRGLGYCYNGKSQDTPGSGSYSGMPPAVGIDFFQGPYMDPDGLDNPKIDIPKILSDSYTNLQVKNLLSNYKMKKKGTSIDSIDAYGRQVYDTISITDDADLFFATSETGYDSWYFHPGDAVGNCAINGVNFGNNIVDDERFGMRRFVYYDNSLNAIYGEPVKANDYYNYLRGYWKNGQRMKYGGNAVSTGIDPANLDCDFMFPDNSDPWHWGTDGEMPSVNPDDWREITAGNSPGDRRFMQSAGPFTLKPGALNYITVGIPFAQASSGDGQWASVSLLREIDDVCQALFENCFKVLDGPDAPTMTAQELSNEIILYLNYEDRTSNNYNEKYREVDPAIVRSYTDASGNTHLYDSVARSFIFEGYQIYQLKDGNTSIADINDASKARLVAQCDIENYYDTILSIDTVWTITSAGDTVVHHIDTTWNPNPSLPIGTLTNFTTNTQTGLLTGTVMVEGANKGIQHVFRITNDAFATGQNTGLVNNREYYFIAIAYAQNRFKEYSQTEAAFLDGQKEPYLAGRKNERGGSITPITVIPHNPAVEDGGKVAQAEFGMSPNIIRIEGFGNGTTSGLRLTEQSITELMGAPGVEGKGPGTYVNNFTTGIGGQGDRSYMTSPCIIAHPQYEENYGPINVRVIDPLKLKEGRFNILFWNAIYDADGNITNVNNDTVGGGVNKNTRWCIVNADGGPVYDTFTRVWSHFSISRYNEQIFPELGIAVSLLNPKAAASSIDVSGYKNTDGTYKTNYYPGKFYQGFVKEGALLGSSMKFADENKQWLYGLPDNDSYLIYNWIRSGSQFSANAYENFISSSSPYSVNEAYLDEDYFKAWKVYSATVSSSIDSSEGIDKTQVYESVVGGTWAPYGVVSTMPFHPGFSFASFITDDDHMLDSLGVSRYRLERMLLTNIFNKALNYNELAKLPSVRIVLTADQSKWTRCPVVEMCDDYTLSEGNARRFAVRRHASVNKDGLTAAECAAQGITYAAGSTDDPEYISANGMGWFPGYAINTVSGERLNIMFGEDSRYVQHNGRDMMWNPDNSTMEGTQNYVLGGRHYIYVMNATRQTFYDLLDRDNGINRSAYTTYVTPSYDAGRWAMNMLQSAERMLNSELYPTTGTKLLYKGLVSRADNYVPVRDSIAMLYASTAWVNIPLVNPRYAFDNPKDIPCDVTVDIDIRTPYSKYMSFNGTDAMRTGNTAINKNMPVYQFVINPSDAVLENLATANGARQSYVDSILSLINVVPNPYYSYSNYETASQLETKVRFINLPTGVNKDGKKEGCYIRIYTSDGTLVRSLGPTPVNSTTYDWDLHNQTGIPIAGGMYLIHITVPGIGERVVKWFGTMRPVDLNSFGF